MFLKEIAFRGDIDVPSLFLPIIGGSLQSLDLYKCNQITDNGVRFIAESCPNLQSLNLSFCSQITDKGVNLIAESCSSNLLSLDVCWCNEITDNGVGLIMFELAVSQSKFL